MPIVDPWQFATAVADGCVVPPLLKYVDLLVTPLPGPLSLLLSSEPFPGLDFALSPVQRPAFPTLTW